VNGGHRGRVIGPCAFDRRVGGHQCRAQFRGGRLDSAYALSERVLSDPFLPFN
jgi:hypothetical protein